MLIRLLLFVSIKLSKADSIALIHELNNSSLKKKKLASSYIIKIIKGNKFIDY